jgi:diguanylate cyclase (GGDEF)-like protein/PAS domain S-box-containing protein
MLSNLTLIKTFIFNFNVIKLDINKNIKYINKNFTKTTGYQKKDIYNQNISVLNAPDFDSEVDLNEINMRLSKGKPWNGIIKNKRKNGDEYFVDSSISVIKDKFNNFLYYLVLEKDISHMFQTVENLKYNLKRTEDSLNFDSLTNSFNRTKFDLDFIDLSKNDGIVMLDIDFFKSINDTYGHLNGDKVLKGLVTLFKNNFRKEDSIYRIGGEEFIIIFKNISYINLIKEVDKFRILIENEDFGIDKKITSSFGFTFIEDEENIEKDFILEIIDEALYEVKNNGRNSICFKKI